MMPKSSVSTYILSGEFHFHSLVCSERLILLVLKKGDYFFKAFSKWAHSISSEKSDCKKYVYILFEKIS